MTLSEVFYEAACRIEETGWSCIAVSKIDPDARPVYEKLMGQYTPCCGHKEICPALVSETAKSLNWRSADFRTFMLLMASEAVK